jgi:transcription-repair coupling factor (superfamily II helicase)
MSRILVQHKPRVKLLEKRFINTECQEVMEQIAEELVDRFHYGPRELQELMDERNVADIWDE